MLLSDVMTMFTLISTGSSFAADGAGVGGIVGNGVGWKVGYIVGICEGAEVG